MWDNGRIFVASAGLLPDCLFVLPLDRMSAVSDAALSAQTERGEGRGCEAFGGNCHDSLQPHAGCYSRILVWKSDLQKKKDRHVIAGILEQK